MQIVKRSGFPQRLVTIGCDRQPPALALLHGQADAFELDLGTRFPAMPNEEIVVRNDGGVRNETHSFAFGETCHSDPDLKTWFIVKQIVGEHVLVELTHARTALKPVNP